MSDQRQWASRRTFLLGSASAAVTSAIKVPFAWGQVGSQGITLRAARAATRLGATPAQGTDVWAYNGSVPGPTIRARQGNRLRVVVENALAEDTTVHWHGVRVPNAMDGVPHLTQAPIGAGQSFIYEFEVPDAGTYWYHPHHRSAEQVERGLHGALIVEEREPIEVDRDMTWLLDDWRLLPSGGISEDFSNFMDASHNGRVGNFVTINGQAPDALAVRSGERIRLRLINAANARIFGLDFQGHAPIVIAIDGQPVEPHEPNGGLVVLAPAMRIDLALDAAARPGERFTVVDRFYRRLEYDLIALAYAETPLRRRPPDTPVALASNALAEPDLGTAERHEVTLGGGMMGRMNSAMMNGQRMDMREMMRGRVAWAMNGVASTEHVHAPMLTLKRGRSYVLKLVNDTAWHHPMHLHGHSFRVIARNGTATRRREWQDTVLMAPNERVDIAFVADNPGDWMFHCHILEHQAAGMMSVLRVG